MTEGRSDRRFVGEDTDNSLHSLSSLRFAASLGFCRVGEDAENSLRSFRAVASSAAAYAVASSAKTSSYSPESMRSLNVRASSPSMVTPSVTQVPATSLAAFFVS